VRLREIDALRAGLVYGVVVFHSARVFDPFDFTVKADTESVLAGAFVLFASLWGMPLVFVLAGYGIWHSLGRRTAGPMGGARARNAVPQVAAVELVRRVPVARILLGLRSGDRERRRSSVVAHGLRLDRRAGAHP
jgi:glucan biosynthesis protein C